MDLAWLSWKCGPAISIDQHNTACLMLGGGSDTRVGSLSPRPGTEPSIVGHDHRPHHIAAPEGPSSSSSPALPSWPQSTDTPAGHRSVSGKQAQVLPFLKYPGWLSLQRRHNVSVHVSPVPATLAPWFLEHERTQRANNDPLICSLDTFRPVPTRLNLDSNSRERNRQLYTLSQSIKKASESRVPEFDGLCFQLMHVWTPV